MNKKVLFASLIALSGLFATASAQKVQQVASQSCCTEQSCTAPQGKAAYNPFAGLNLTEQQQAKLDALKQEKQAAKEAAKKDKADRKQADRAKAQQSRADDLAKIKAILTPEQYVTFLENNYLSSQPRKLSDRKFDRSQAQAKKSDKFSKGDKPGKSGRADKGDKSKK